MQLSANIVWIRRLIWVYFVLLIFEGVLRKWVVPGLSNPLLLVRAPIVIVIYALAIQGYIFPWNRWVVGCCLLAFLGLFAGLLVLADTPIVPLFGFQADFLHLPLIFVIPRVFDLRDVRQIGYWTLVFSIPMALLMVLQFQAAPTSVLNAGAAGSVNGQISAALGHIRPAGTFTFITGPAAFFPFVAAFLLIGPFINLRYPTWLQTASSLALIVGAGVSSSRTLAASVGIVIACALVGGTVFQPFIVSQRVIMRAVQGAVLLAIVAFGVSHLPVFQAGLETFSTRIASASGTEASTGGFTGRIASGFTGPLDLLATTPLLGDGLGLGTNAGSALVNSGEVKYMLAEDEWSRVLLESGPVIGGIYLLMRVGLVVWLAWITGKIGRQGNVLPFLLLGCCAPGLVSGQFGQPTELGFAVFGAGLTLAAMRWLPAPQGTVSTVPPAVSDEAGYRGMKFTKTAPLKVLLVGNYAADQQLSMLGFAGALLTGLCDRGVETRLLAPAQVLGRFGRPHDGIGKWLGYIDKFVLFPRQLRRALAWADVVHVCDQGNAMYIPYLRHTPHVLTCNDLMAVRAAHGEMPGWKPGRTGRTYQKLILGGINRAGHVACISETTRHDLLRLSRVPGSHISVVPEGLLYPYRRMPDDESQPHLGALGLDSATPYLLHVGGNQPYKNRPGVLKIYAALRRLTPDTPLRLVLAGKPLPDALRRDIVDHALSAHVLTPTGLSNEQLRALYSRATALVFPSLFEGFGLPIIEAQACGCPVFTSDRAPMTEVGGQAAVYFDPTQPAQAAQVIADNLPAAERMAAAGLLNVKNYATERMVDDYLALYRRVLSAT